MAQKLNKSDLDYIKANFRYKSNRQLAEDLRVDKNTIVHAINSLGLRRTHEEEIKLKTQGFIEKPKEKSQPLIPSSVPMKFHYIATAVIFVLVFLLYANTFGNRFVWDDEILVVQNNYIKTWNHIPEFFTQNTFKGGDRDSNFWRPVQLFSYLIDFQLWGLEPFGFHLSNTFYHALVSVLIYILVFLLFRRKELSLLAALLFAVHPIHTEAVTYIAGRADSQATIFILLSLCLYVRYTHSRSPKDIIVYFGSFLSLILSLMSKEMAMMTPAYMLIIDIFTFKNQKRKSFLNLFLRYLPFLVVLSIYLYSRATILDFATIPLLKEQPAQKIPVFLRFITFTRSLFAVMLNPATHDLDLGYLWLLFFPFNLHMERGMPYAKSSSEWPYFLSLLGFIFLIILAIYLFRKSKTLSFGMTFFIIALIPFMDLIPLNANMAEHWLYIPSIGFFVFLAELLIMITKIKSHLSSQDLIKKIVFSPIAIYIIYCSILTVIRNLDWKDEFTIWKETARLSNSSHIHGNLGVAYGRRGDFASAKEEFIKALRLQFNYPEAHNNLGVLLMMEGNLQEAKKEFEYAIQFNPNYSNAYKNLGDIHQKLGNKEDARKMWETALQINPYHEEARQRLQSN